MTSWAPTPQLVSAAQLIASRLQLDRPLALLDVETTGVNVDTDRVVELAIITILPMGLGMVNVIHAHWLINPGIPIPASASAIHGITDADVSAASSFRSMAREIAQALTGRDLAGYNARRFDVRILEAEFVRAGVAWPCGDARVIDPYAIFIRQEPRDLEGAVTFYCDRFVKEDETHHALNDTALTLEVLAAQLDRYEDLPTTVGELHLFCENRDPSWIDSTGKIAWRDGQAVLNIGKHAGRTLAELVQKERPYISWMTTKDFPADTKQLLERALRGQLPVAPVQAP